MPTAILSVSTGRRYIYDEIIACVKNGDDRKQFERMCISTISHPDSNDDTFVLLERGVRGVPHIPVSILSNPATLDYADLARMRDLGADIFTVALDAVTPEIFDRTRECGVDSPHQWEKYWRTLEWAAEIYGPEKFGAHLICGMGETEQEILEVAQRIRDRGGGCNWRVFLLIMPAGMSAGCGLTARAV